MIIIAAAAVMAYLRVRATAERVEERIDRVEKAARGAASRATSATRATISAAARKFDHTTDHISSATRAGWHSAAEQVTSTTDRISSATRTGWTTAREQVDSTTDRISSATRARWSSAAEHMDITSDRISSATASATSRTRAILSAPAEKWARFRNGETSASTSAAEDAESSSKLDRLRGHLHVIRDRNEQEENTAAPKTPGRMERLRSKVRSFRTRDTTATSE